MSRAALALLALGIAGIAAAQTGLDAPLPARVELRDVELRDAIGQLLGPVGVSWTLAPDVRGRVTGTFEAIPARSALLAALGPVGATFRVENGVVAVVSAAQSNPDRLVDVPPAQAASRIAARFGVPVVVDASLLGPVDLDLPGNVETVLGDVARQLDARVVREGEGYRLVPRNSLARPLPRLQRKNADLRALVIELLNSTGVSYVVSTGIRGTVDVDLRDTDVRSALETLLAPIRSRIELRKGVFLVRAN